MRLCILAYTSGLHPVCILALPLLADPGICGCGPSCPEPCGSDFTPCPCSENLYCNYPIGCLKFTSNSYVEPWPCPCGQGYVKAGGAPPTAAPQEMER